MIKLIDGKYTAIINPVGAELSSYQTDGVELMKDSDKFWGKKAPVLFPFIGAIKEDTFSFEGVEHKKERHGFVRDSVFKIVTRTENYVCLEETIDYYLPLTLKIEYSIKNGSLYSRFTVINSNDKDVHFKLGWHPGFKLMDKLNTYTLNTDSELYMDIQDTGMVADGKIKLSKEIKLDVNFSNLNTFIYKGDYCKIENDKHSIEMIGDGFGMFGVWAPKNEDVDFICIEPWSNATDNVNEPHDITKSDNKVVCANSTYEMEAFVNVKIKG